MTGRQAELWRNLYSPRNKYLKTFNLSGKVGTLSGSAPKTQCSVRYHSSDRQGKEATDGWMDGWMHHYLYIPPPFLMKKILFRQTKSKKKERMSFFYVTDPPCGSVGNLKPRLNPYLSPISKNAVCSARFPALFLLLFHWEGKGLGEGGHTFHLPSSSVSVSVSVSLSSSPCSPSVSLSSSLSSSCFRRRLGGAVAPAMPPDLRADIWPARESACVWSLAGVVMEGWGQEE